MKWNIQCGKSISLAYVLVKGVSRVKKQSRNHVIDHECFQSSAHVDLDSQVIVWLIILACSWLLEKPVSIFLVACSLVVLLLIFESVKLACGSGVCLCLLSSWLGLGLVLLGLQGFGR